MSGDDYLSISKGTTILRQAPLRQSSVTVTMLNLPPSPPPIVAYVDIKKVDMGQAKDTVDRALAYVWPSIIVYASAAISFKCLIWFIKAGKGD